MRCPSGYGIYGVFWYGQHREGTLPKHPNGKAAPKSALELEVMLNDIIAAEQRSKLRAVVIDVAVPDGQPVGTARKKWRRKTPARKIPTKASKPARKLAVDNKQPMSGKSRAGKISRRTP
jgi:hypothetical protein